MVHRGKGDPVTEDDVDHRFDDLVAALNSWSVATDRLFVADPAGEPGRGRWSPERDQVSTQRVVVLRVFAAVVAAAVAGAGASIHWSRSAPVTFWLVWLLVVVPAATLVAVMVFDRVRRGKRDASR
jgi:hypothetical protein